MHDPCLHRQGRDTIWIVLGERLKPISKSRLFVYKTSAHCEKECRRISTCCGDCRAIVHCLPQDVGTVRPPGTSPPLPGRSSLTPSLRVFGTENQLNPVFRRAFEEKGGTNHMENLQLLCGACNSMKGTISQAAFVAKLKKQGMV